MLGWPTTAEWRLDNDWRSLDTAPADKPVDVFCHKYDPRKRQADERWTGRRVHGARLTARGWTGIPEGYDPKFWTDAMPAARIRALAA